MSPAGAETKKLIGNVKYVQAIENKDGVLIGEKRIRHDKMSEETVQALRKIVNEKNKQKS
jgi:hypothetical protein